MTKATSDDLPDGVAKRTVNKEGVILYWDAEGEVHNPAGPARICPDKATYWLVTGRDPNTKPDRWFGAKTWLYHGEIHRTDGPAMEYGDGTVEYWVNDIEISAHEFNQKYQENTALRPRRIGHDH